MTSVKRFLQSAAGAESHGTATEGVEPDRPAVGLLSVLMVVLSVVLLGVALGASLLLWDYTRRQIDEAVNSQAPAELQQVRARDADRLGKYDVVDPAKGLYQVPIDRAIELLVKKQSVELSPQGK